MYYCTAFLCREQSVQCTILLQVYAESRVYSVLLYCRTQVYVESIVYCTLYYCTAGLCNEQSVPVVYSLPRYKLGRICLRKVPVSCIAIMNHQGSDVSDFLFYFTACTYGSNSVMRIRHFLVTRIRIRIREKPGSGSFVHKHA